jgi:hypothetical protein
VEAVTRWHATLTNGDRHVVDTAARTVTPDDRNVDRPFAKLVAPTVEHLLVSGGLIGPQVDDFTGIRGDWADDRAPLAAMIHAARQARLGVVTWEPAG